MGEEELYHKASCTAITKLAKVVFLHKVNLMAWHAINFHLKLLKDSVVSSQIM